MDSELLAALGPGNDDRSRWHSPHCPLYTPGPAPSGLLAL